MAAAQGLLQLVLEKITARIAVSALARKVQVEHLGGGAWEIPNGVVVARFAGAEPLTAGRVTAPRTAAVRSASSAGSPRRARASGCWPMRSLPSRPQRPGLRLLVAGPGERGGAVRDVPDALHDRVTFLGMVSEADKARMLRSVDIYVAPNTGGESFGMILTEAMAAGTPIVASDLDAFRRVLDGGHAGLLFPTGDAEALTKSLRELLDDPAQRAAYAAEAARVVAAYDWPAVAQRVLEVYALAIEATTGESVHVDAATPL